MLNAKQLLIASTLPLIIGLAGCGKKDETTGDGSTIAEDTLLAAAQTQGQASAQQAAMPQPDLSRSLDSYHELQSGQQVMFLYAAAAKLPPDFEKMAETFSSEYRNTSDAFRKNDLMKAIKPQIEQQIAAANANPYVWVELDDASLDSYDFERKGFRVDEFTSEISRYFGDATRYSYGWANRSQVDFAPVPDESLAREIESMRTKWNNKPRLKIFFFAQSADLNEQKVNAFVTRVQIVDRKGRVLVEYGPK